MASIKSLMLGAAILAGAAGLGTASANAAQFGVYLGTQSAYVPPCPGPGYEWVAGYYGDGYWVPGRWAYVGGYDRDDYYRHRDWDRDRDRYRSYDRDDYRHGDWDRGRHHDRDDHRDWDRYRR